MPFSSAPLPPLPLPLPLPRDLDIYIADFHAVRASRADVARVSDRIGDAGARAIERAAHQLELRDQSVVAFQELITFLGELFVEFFELVDPALQARDVTFERMHRVLIFSVLAPQLGSSV